MHYFFRGNASPRKGNALFFWESIPPKGECIIFSGNAFPRKGGNALFFRGNAFPRKGNALFFGETHSPGRGMHYFLGKRVPPKGECIIFWETPQTTIHRPGISFKSEQIRFLYTTRSMTARLSWNQRNRRGHRPRLQKICHYLDRL